MLPWDNVCSIHHSLDCHMGIQALASSPVSIELSHEFPNTGQQPCVYLGIPMWHSNFFPASFMRLLLRECYNDSFASAIYIIDETTVTWLCEYHPRHMTMWVSSLSHHYVSIIPVTSLCEYHPCHITMWVSSPSHHYVSIIPVTWLCEYHDRPAPVLSITLETLSYQLSLHL